MEPENYHYSRLNRYELFALAVLVAIAGAAIFYLQSHYTRAFPEYTITFKVDQRTALQMTDDFLGSYGTATEDFKRAVIFDIDQRTKTFLERTQEPEVASQLMQAAVPVWYWAVRVFQPLNPEEYRLHITPQGAIVAYEHTIPEDRRLPALSRQKALKVCHQFLQKVAHFEPRGWILVEERTEKRPQRVDHYFSFQKKNHQIAEAVERLEVTVKGNQIGSYHSYLKLPENWLRDYQHLRSQNSSTALIAQVGMVLFVVAIFIKFIQNARKRLLVWKPILIWGAVTLVLSFITQVNSLPLRLFELDANQSLANFYGTFFLMALLASLGLAFLVMMIIGASEALNAQVYPRQIAFHALFTPTGLRTKHFFFSTVTGLCLVPIFMAFQTGFYILASRLGAWAPVEVGYSNVVNTALPWLFVLFGGFAPAVSEEGIFRLFAIPYLTRVFRSRLLAVLIPAFIWGFAHANYPHQPFWIRGVEVGFFGVLVGLVFLKINVLPLLIWHYTVDAFYSATLLLKIGNLYDILSAAFCAGIFFFPLIYNLVYYLRHRSFAPEDQLTYAKRLPYAVAPRPEPSPALPQLTRTYSGQTTRQRLILTIFAVAFLLALNGMKIVPPSRRYPVDRQAAMMHARKFLQAQEVVDTSFHWAIELAANYDALTSKYLFERTDYRHFQNFIQHTWPNSVAWQIRFFRPLATEEWHVGVNPTTGEVVAFEHILPEDAPGANLAPSSARRQVEKFLRQQGIELSAFVLEKSEHLQRKKRTDHHFSYLSKPGSPYTIGEARLRIEVQVKGGAVASFKSQLKLPEEWRLKQTQQTTIQIVWLVLKIAAVLLIVGLGIYYILQQPRPSSKPLRRFWPLGLIVCALALINLLAEYHTFLWSYQTSWDLSTYHLVWSILVFMQLLAIGLLCLLSYWILVFCQPELFRRSAPDSRPAYHQDAVLGSMFTIAGFLMMGKILFWFQQQYYPPALAGQFYLPDVLASGCPLVAALQAIVLATWASLLGLSVLGFIWQKTPLAVWLKIVIMCFLLALLFLPADLDWRKYAVEYGTAMAFTGWLLICVLRVLKNNYLAYFYAAWGFFTLRQSLVLWQTKATVGKRTAILLISLWLIGILWNYLHHTTLPRLSFLHRGTREGH